MRVGLRDTAAHGSQNQPMKSFYQAKTTKSSSKKSKSKKKTVDEEKVQDDSEVTETDSDEEMIVSVSRKKKKTKKNKSKKTKKSKSHKKHAESDPEYASDSQAHDPGHHGQPSTSQVVAKIHSLIDQDSSKGSGGKQDSAARHAKVPAIRLSLEEHFGASFWPRTTRGSLKKVILGVLRESQY